MVLTQVHNNFELNDIIAIDCEFQELLLEKTPLTNDNKNNSKKEKFYIILDYVLAAVFFGPLSILYWASTWDIFYYYIFGNHPLLSASITLLIGLFIHLLAYLLQDVLQKIYYRTDEELLIEQETSRNSLGYSYKALYAYFLSIAYVAQWRGLWDIYSYFIDEIDLIYAFYISLCGIIMYWFVLKRSFYSYATTTPYYLSPDVMSNSYFLKDNIIEFNKVSYFNLIFKIQ